MQYYKILLVEDSRAVQAAMAGLLEGTPLASAMNLEEAWKCLTTDSIDMVLLDVFLPDGSGYDFCAKMRNDARFTHTPVIFLTSASKTEEIEKGFQVGGNDYVKKPFILEELYARIQNQLKSIELSRLVQKQKDLHSNESIIAQMSHEINNPLQIALGFLNRLKPDNEVDKDTISKIANALNRITKLVSDSSKAHEKNMQSLSKELLDLNKKNTA